MSPCSKHGGGHRGQAPGYVATVRLEGDSGRLVLGEQDAALSSSSEGPPAEPPFPAAASTLELEQHGLHTVESSPSPRLLV